MSTDPVILLLYAVIIGIVVSGIYQARKKARATAAALPISGEGVHAGSRYVLGRETWGVGKNRSGSTTSFVYVQILVLESPREWPCRFIFDEDIWRGSTFFRSIRLRSAWGLEIGPPFWRSDERQRLKVLRSDPQFEAQISSLHQTPSFASLAAVNAADGHIPLENVARRLAPEQHDVLMLHRKSQSPFATTPEEIRADLNRLAELRDLLLNMAIPNDVPRARVASRGGLITMAALRIVILLGTIIGALMLFIWATQ